MTDDISKVYAALRSIRYNANNGSQDRPPHHRLSLIANEADKAIAAIESATTPAEVGERHVRHEGGGVIALYEGDQRIREIGVAFTTGWDHRDRDEFIVRYNEHATLARQLAEAKAEIERRTSDMIVVGGTALACSQAVKEMFDLHKSQLAEATRRVGEVEGLVGKWRQRSKIEASAAREFDDPDEMAWHEGKAAQLDESADELEAELTKEPTK